MKYIKVYADFADALAARKLLRREQQTVAADTASIISPVLFI